MIRYIDAIFAQGVLRPVEPLVLPEGTLVHLRLQEDSDIHPAAVLKIHTPKLARREDVANFRMEVQQG